MSVFSNLASEAGEHAGRYVSAVLELLGKAEPADVLRRTPSKLAALVETMTDAQMVAREAEGKWAIRDVLQHLADTELATGWRIRLVLAQDRPVLTAYDQDLWAEHLHYDRAEPAKALEEFKVLRRANLGLIQQATPEGLRRVGIHAERGEQTLDQIVRLTAGHDLLHLRQIERIRAVVL
jgi:hypothetical protein